MHVGKQGLPTTTTLNTRVQSYKTTVLTCTCTLLYRKLGHCHWVCRESWAHKRLFNLPPQFSRLGTEGPAFLFFRFVCCVFRVLSVPEVLSLLLSNFSLATMLYTCFFPCTCTCVPVAITPHYVHVHVAIPPHYTLAAIFVWHHRYKLSTRV